MTEPNDANQVGKNTVPALGSLTNAEVADELAADLADVCADMPWLAGLAVAASERLPARQLELGNLADAARHGRLAGRTLGATEAAVIADALVIVFAMQAVGSLARTAENLRRLAGEGPA